MSSYADIMAERARRAAELAKGATSSASELELSSNPFTNAAEILDMADIQLSNQRDVSKESLSGQQTGQRTAEIGQAIQLAALAEMPDDVEKLMIQKFNLSAQPANVIPTTAFLRPPWIEGTLIRKMARRTPFRDWGARHTVDRNDIVIPYESHAVHNDPVLSDPTFIAETAELPLVAVSDLKKRQLAIGKQGFATLFSDDAMRNTGTAFSEVDRKLDVLARGFADKENRVYLDEIAYGFDQNRNNGKPIDEQINFFTAQKTWDDPQANPLQDIRDAVLISQERDEWEFDPTEIHLPPKSWHDINTYAQNVDHDWVIDPLSREKVLMVDEVRVFRLPPRSGVEDGNALLVARGPDIPAVLDVYDRVNPDLSRSGTMHVQRKFREESLTTWFGFHRSYACINRTPPSVTAFEGLR